MCLFHRLGILYNLYKTCPITPILHVYQLTFTSGGRGDDGGVTSKKAAKEAIAVQVCIWAFVSVRTQDIFEETWGHFHTFVATETENLS